MVGDGQPRSKPFAAFGVGSPTVIRRLTAAGDTKTVYALDSPMKIGTLRVC
jgi:hypothetical protein